jgi:IS30 family transposase
LEKGYSIRGIAKQLGRSHSNIREEIKRNSVRGEYDPRKADHKARVRRNESKYQGMKIAENQELQEFVENGLCDDLSPEAIAGRITEQEKHLPSVSKDSIRRYIKSPYGRKVEYHRIKQKRKRRRARKRGKLTKLNDRVFIDKRPEYINKRRRTGDAESDFLVSGRSGKGIILNVVDRKSRVLFLEIIRKVSIENVHLAFQRIKARFPELKTITTDNDILLKRHKELEILLGVKIYFCDPYSSWQKGTVENTNKYIRRDIPKGSDISRYSKRFIRLIEEKLNRRPLKCLGYKTPREALNQYRKHKKR